MGIFEKIFGKKPRERVGLREEEQNHRNPGKTNSKVASLGSQAQTLADRGDLEGALKLLKEQEHICYQTGDLGGLAATLEKQAEIYWNRGDEESQVAAIAILNRKNQMINQRE